MADVHPYGLAPGEFGKLSAEKQRSIIRKIMAHLVNAVPADSACWAEQVNPEEFRNALAADQHLWNHFMTHRAKGELKLLATLREGGKGMSEAKAALEILERTYKGWERKATVNLSKQLEEVLEALAHRLGGESANRQFTGAEAYDIVVGELERGT